MCNNIYDKITKYGEHLVETGEAISREYGVPIINKRVSVTPISLVAGASDLTSYVDIARTLDKAAKEIGINFIGGFSALVERGMSKGDRILIDSIAESLAVTDLVCSSVAVGSTKAGINMDAVAEMGRVFKDLAERTKDQDALAAPNSSLLQCRRRQPLHGRRLPRRHQWGFVHQRRCQRPGRRQSRPGTGQRPAL